MKLRNKCKHEYNMTHSHHYGYTLECDKCGEIETYDSKDKGGSGGGCVKWVWRGGLVGYFVV